jgi:flagellar hook-associated protein 3 FlgL
MRVTQETYYRTLMQDLYNLQSEAVGLDKQVSTGHRVNRPSDAPSYSVTILDSQQATREIDQYRTNLENASTWMTGSEENLQSIVDLLNRAKTLAEQMATGTIQELEHRSTASEVNNLVQEILRLANTQVEGDYIFSGTRTENPAVSETVQAQSPAELISDASSGHGTVASTQYNSGTGLYHLYFTRDETGADQSVTLAGVNSLGDSTGFSFDAADWAAVQHPGPSQAGIYRTRDGVAAPGNVISTELGEELTWTGDPAAGAQTFRTDAVYTVTGAGTATIGGNLYAVTTAEELVNLINADPAAAGNYFATLEGADTVRVVSQGGGALALLSAGAVSVDGDHSLQDVQSAVNFGERASGYIQFTAAGMGLSDTVTVGGNTWTWEEISGGAAPAGAAAAAADLAAQINSATNDYQAEVVSFGGSSTVVVTARATGSGANGATLATSTPGIANTSGQLYGGLEATETETAGSLYATGSSTLRRSTTLRCTVLEADGDDVSVRVQWYDDDGGLHEQDVTLSADGQDNAVAIAGTGGVSLYRNDLDFQAGAVFDLKLGRYRGNEEELAVNFSTGGTLVYNWNAGDFLGDESSVNLLGETATAKDPSSSGTVHLAGSYTGLLDRDITFDVIDGGQVPGDEVVFRVSFRDDEGALHQHNVALTAAGRENAAVLPVNGVLPKVDLSGVSAAADPANVTDGGLELGGDYRGLTSRDLDFTVSAVAGNEITVDVTWTDDQGVSRTRQVTVDGYGSDHAATVPDCNGVKFHLEEGTVPFAVGDSFNHEIRMHPDNAGDGIFFYVDNQTFAAGESFHYQIDKNPVHVLDTLQEFSYQLTNGDHQAAQTQSQKTLQALSESLEHLLNTISDAGTRQNRIEVRRNVLSEREGFAAQNLEDLQDVDLNQAFLKLRANQTAYNASLKTVSLITDLFLANML